MKLQLNLVVSWIVSVCCTVRSAGGAAAPRISLFAAVSQLTDVTVGSHSNTDVVCQCFPLEINRHEF